MHFDRKKYRLPILAGLLGLLACALRLAISRWAVDTKGLLIAGHPLSIALWLITVAAVLLIVLQVRKLDGSPRYSDNFGPDLLSAAGCILLAVGIFLTILGARFDTLPLEILRNLAGAVSILALTWVGICRRDGKMPFFLYYGLVCLYLTLHIVSRYQSWSGQPQLMGYFFPMTGSLLLALFAYQQTAFSVGLGKRRMQLAIGLLGGFFCFGAMALGRDVLLYLTGGFWMLTGLCDPVPVPRRRKNPISEAPREQP